MTHRLLALAVAFSLTPLSFQASAANVVEAKATLSKLSYQLTDLDKTDGIAPSLMFNLSPYEGTGLSIYDQDLLNSPTNGGAYGFIQGSVFANTNKTLTVSGLTASAAKTGTTLSTSATYSTTEAAVLLNAPYAPTTYLGEPNLSNSRHAEVYANGSLMTDVGLAFILAPHTSVVFSGQIDLKTSVDVTALLNSPAYAKAVANQASLFLGSSASIELYLLTSELDDPQHVMFGADSGLTLDPLGHQVREDYPSSANTTFTLTYSNTSDQAVTQLINYNIRSDVYLGVTSVPENSTLVLQTLGLTLLGVAFRARQKQS